VEFSAVGVTLAGDSNYASTSIALNGLYDFNLFGDSKVKTYAGAGLVYLSEVDFDFETSDTEQSLDYEPLSATPAFGWRF
jgi:hypothetical protein